MHGYQSEFPKSKIHVHYAQIDGEGLAVIGKRSGSHTRPEIEEKEILIWTAEIRTGLISEWQIYEAELKC